MVYVVYKGNATQYVMFVLHTYERWTGTCTQHEHPKNQKPTESNVRAWESIIMRMYARCLMKIVLSVCSLRIYNILWLRIAYVTFMCPSGTMAKVECLCLCFVFFFLFWAWPRPAFYTLRFDVWLFSFFFSACHCYAFRFICFRYLKYS